ncbi:choice-of-anchor J domain-containing protein [Halosquirtibacter laminarini]|uniref:Choice-of-anchor J domain-containing protein n=1 Tax=Halosquirtibacter laminarini TaxID=3374600 RepID=A0AC61NG88_9BACT|nr:choice-of-anchor J domain-containing protein [Prolixibacteraceae bacterium]
MAKNIFIYTAIFFLSLNVVFAKKNTVVFDGKIASEKLVRGTSELSQFTTYSLMADGQQESNKKWLKVWGVWNANDASNQRARCLNFVCNRVQNDDWLVTNSIDLTNVTKPFLLLDYYSRYGSDKANKFEILISIDFAGDVSAATWTSLPFTVFNKLSHAEPQKISIKKYQGKKVHIAFHVSATENKNELKNMTRNYFVTKVQVVGKK